MTDSDTPRGERAADESPDLAALVDQVGCSNCDATGLCPSCEALASLIQAEVRLRRQ